MLGAWDNDGSRLNRPELTDYLDADGGILLPEGTDVVTFLDRHIADIGDAVAYRYLDYSQHAEGKMIELTWAELGTRLRAIGARLQQITSKGDRVAILAPQGIDYIIGFFAAIKAGDIAVPLFAPEFPGHAERLDAVLGDARPSVVLTTRWVLRTPRYGWTPTTLPTFNTPRGPRDPRLVWRSPIARSALTCCRW